MPCTARGVHARSPAPSFVRATLGRAGVNRTACFALPPPPSKCDRKYETPDGGASSGYVISGTRVNQPPRLTSALGRRALFKVDIFERDSLDFPSLVSFYFSLSFSLPPVDRLIFRNCGRPSRYTSGREMTCDYWERSTRYRDTVINRVFAKVYVCVCVKQSRGEEVIGHWRSSREVISLDVSLCRSSIL